MKDVYDNCVCVSVCVCVCVFVCDLGDGVEGLKMGTDGRAVFTKQALDQSLLLQYPYAQCV